MSQSQPPTRQQWQAPYYPPPPETYYPPQSPIPPTQPPRKPTSQRGFILTISVISVVLILVLGLIWRGITSTTASVDTYATATANDSLTATAQANMNATDTAANTALSNDLTQTAMTPTAQPTVPIDTTGVGSTQASGPWAITINSIKPTQAGLYDSAPKSGDRYILINFTALNTDASAHDMSPIDFTLRDDQGNTYDLWPTSVCHPTRAGPLLVGRNCVGIYPMRYPRHCTA